MQDTPQFQAIQQRFSAYSESTLLGVEGQQQLPEHGATLVKRIFETVQLYLNDTSYRQTLPLQTKQNIEGQIENINNQFDQISAARTQGNLPQQSEGFINNLGSYYEELRVRFIVPYGLFTIEGKTNTARIVSDLQKTKEEADTIQKEIQKTLEVSQEFVARKGATEQANFFHRLHNGKEMPSPETKKIDKKTEYWKPTSQNVIGFLALLVFAAMAAPSIWFYIDTLSKKVIFQYLLFFVAVTLSVATYLVYCYTIRLKKLYPAGFERAAQFWFLGVLGSLVFVSVYSALVIRSLQITQDSLSIQEAVVKAVVLLAPVYLIRFCVRNYNANKHLSSTNLQRANSISVAELFTRGINSENKEAYIKLIELIFTQDETGYITKREGAGSNDTSIDLPIVK